MDRLESAKRDAKRLEQNGIMEARYTSVGKDGRVVIEPGLHAEVVRRQAKVDKRRVDDDVVACELKPTLKLSGERKKDWLFRALLAVPKGKAQIQEIYSIVTHPKFATNVEEWHGEGMYRMLKDNIKLFSEKQHKTLLSKCDLAQRFKENSPSRSASPARAREPPQQRSRVRRSPSTSRNDKDTESDMRPRRNADQAAVAGPLVPLTTRESKELKDAMSESFHDDSHKRSMEEHEKMAAALRERHHQQQAELQRQLEEKRVQEEREKQRKAKLGNAFALEDDEDEEQLRVPSALSLMKSRDERRQAYDEKAALGATLAAKGALPTDLPRPSASSQSSNVNNRFVESMGGDKVLADVHALLLQKIAPENRSMAGPSLSRKKSPSRSRSRRRARRRSRSKSKSRSPRPGDRYHRSSLRSPTPDGRARGQARAARKAKMIAHCLGLQ